MSAGESVGEKRKLVVGSPNAHAVREFCSLRGRDEPVHKSVRESVLQNTNYRLPPEKTHKVDEKSAFGQQIMERIKNDWHVNEQAWRKELQSQENFTQVRSVRNKNGVYDYFDKQTERVVSSAEYEARYSQFLRASRTKELPAHHGSSFSGNGCSSIDSAISTTAGIDDSSSEGCSGGSSITNNGGSNCGSNGGNSERSSESSNESSKESTGNGDGDGDGNCCSNGSSSLPDTGPINAEATPPTTPISIPFITIADKENATPAPSSSSKCTPVPTPPSANGGGIKELSEPRHTPRSALFSVLVTSQDPLKENATHPPPIKAQVVEGGGGKCGVM